MGTGGLIPIQTRSTLGLRLSRSREVPMNGPYDQAHSRLGDIASLLKALRTIGRDIARFADRETLLLHVARVLRHQGGYSGVWILLHGTDGVWHQAAVVTADGEALSCCDGDGRLCPDLRIALDLAEPHCIRRERRHDLLARRMQSERTLYGILVVADPDLNRRCREELQIFAEIADDIADALWDFDQHQQRQLQGRELQYRYDVERSIVRISCLLTRGRTLDRDQVLAELGRGLHADRVSLFRMAHDGTHASCTHEWCAPDRPGHRAAWQGLAATDFPWWMAALQAGQPMVIADRAEIRDQAPAEYAVLAAADIHAAVAMPFATFAGELMGFISVQSDRPGRTWYQADVDTIRVVAEMLSSVEERLLMLQELERNAADLDRANHLLKEQQGHLLQMQKMEAIGQLAAGVAHEINTPIQFIGDNIRFLQEGFSDLLAYDGQITALSQRPDLDTEALRALVEDAREQADLGYLATEVPQALSQTMDGVKRVATIVQAMKEFAHPGDTELSPVDLNRAIESTVVVSRNEYKYSAELELDLDPDLDSVVCDIGAIKQVLLNLVVNAAHAIQDRHDSEGRGCIRISTRSDENEVRISVADDGCGIPAAIRERIFEPFFTTKEVGRGSGQGLALIQRVIEQQHRGRIDVDSSPGVGTTFTLILPVQLPEDIRAQLSVRSGGYQAITPDEEEI
ncbi:MAG: sensor histidine kinase [Planctomycetota bacterium]